MSNLDIRQLAADRLQDELAAARQTGDFVAVARLAREAISLAEAKLGPHHPDLAGWWCDLGDAKLRLGEWVEADGHFARAESIMVRAQGPKAAGLAEIWFHRGDAAARRGDLPSATKWLQQAVDMIDPATSPEDAMTVRGSLATVLRASGEDARAITMLDEVIALARECTEPMLLARALTERGEWAMAANDFVAAEPLFAEAATVHRDHPQAPLGASQVYSLLGEVLEARGNFVDAASCYETARDLLALQLAGDHPQLGVAALNVAMAKKRAGLPADDSAVDSLRIFVSHFGVNHAHTQRVVVALRDMFGEARTNEWLASLQA